jgi:glyoxylase-like metal-dependent hydrolase (beta-lactamase superfamily II)
MQEIVPGVWQLAGFPRDMFNVYLLGDVLVDAGTRWAFGRILRQLGKRRPALVALTHCHPDHQGAAAALCRHFRIPLACPVADVPAMEGRAPMQPDNFIVRMGVRFWAGSPHPVAQALQEGDRVAAFRVVHAPGHTVGHSMYFREPDRVAVVGDVCANIHFLSGRPGLREPPPFFNASTAENRRSLQRLADLEPRVVCFGHGPPLFEAAGPLQDFAAAVVRRALRRLAARAPQPGGAGL